MISIQITQSFTVVEELALKFIKPLLNPCLKSDKGHTANVLKTLVKHSNKKTICKNQIISAFNGCNECGFLSKSELGVKIHKWRAHRAEEKV